MALFKLEQLYRQVVLDHSHHPRQYSKDIDETNSFELANPTCGDVIQIKVRIIDGVIQNATFLGHGCSISQASASMMMENIIGETIETAQLKVNAFYQLVQNRDITIDLKDAALLQNIWQFPARIKCATLAWKTLEKLLNN